MENKKITVATVCYNADKHIEDTILSILDFSSYIGEFVIVDGCSRDLTVSIIKKYLPTLKNASIEVKFLSEIDNGIYDAMNKAWNMTSLKNHILFLGAGDRIQSLPSELVVDTIYFGIVYKGDEEFSPTLRLGLRLGNSLHHQALLIPRNGITSPFSLEYPTYADYDFNLRLIKSGKYNFIYSKDFIGYALPGGISEKLQLNEMVKICFRNYGYLSALMCYLYCAYQKVRHGI